MKIDCKKISEDLKQVILITEELKSNFKKIPSGKKEKIQHLDRLWDKLMVIKKLINNIESVFISEIDTARPPTTPAWAYKSRKILNHIDRLGIIKWDKRKYDEINKANNEPENFTSKIQNLRSGTKIVHYFNTNSVNVLNANVLDFLLEHQDQIPESWNGKEVYFAGTIYIIVQGGILKGAVKTLIRSTSIDRWEEHYILLDDNWDDPNLIPAIYIE